MQSDDANASFWLSPRLIGANLADNLLVLLLFFWELSLLTVEKIKYQAINLSVPETRKVRISFSAVQLKLDSCNTAGFDVLYLF